MVILISGATHSGKTFMAQKLLEKYHMPYLSIDHLKMGMCRSGFDFGFTPESKDEIITEKLWPILKGIIMTNVENKQNIIIEGCYFPKSINDFEEKYLSEILFFAIIFSEQYIRKNDSKIIQNRNIIENRFYDFDFSNNFMEEIILEHKIKKNICIKHKIKYIEIEEDYENEMETMYEWIDEEMKRNHHAQNNTYQEQPCKQMIT
jgi:putative acetyltransferase